MCSCAVVNNGIMEFASRLHALNLFGQDGKQETNLEWPNQRIYPPYCRTDTYKLSFFPQAINLWDTLPLRIS